MWLADLLIDIITTTMDAAFKVTHCSKGCNNPQPLFDEDRVLCARCYFQHGHETPLHPIGLQPAE